MIHTVDCSLASHPVKLHIRNLYLCYYQSNLVESPRFQHHPRTCLEIKRGFGGLEKIEVFLIHLLDWWLRCHHAGIGDY